MQRQLRIDVPHNRQHVYWENNGGAFVLIYLLCIPLIGLPIMMAEFIIGRHTQKSAVPALAQLGATTFGGDRWKIVGWVGVVAAAVILSYIAVIAGWAVALFVQCVDWSLTGYTAPSENAFGDFLANTSLQFVFAFFFSAATVVIVCKGVVDGIERANKILMPGLFVMIMFLVCYAVTMDGFGEAIGFLFTPRFDALTDQAILEALGHAFFPYGPPPFRVGVFSVFLVQCAKYSFFLFTFARAMFNY